ncbi:unnamed protein product [Brassica rapa]|uniref:Uncharacterized protein n=1 Tax=Brassica campestris TaxID=3711 RepID=A0A8D9GRC3_BRACM|nr:unnamed protein product [Brassica rapa]
MPSVGFRPDALVGGGEIINEMSRDLKYQTDFDTLPGRKYFTCKNFEVIFGFFRVLCVQEKVQMLRKRVDVMAAEITELKYKLNRLNPTSP